MEGEHPFEGVPSNGTGYDYAAQDNIALQNNRLLFPERFLPVHDAIPADVLPVEIRELARQCFGEGHRDRALRPTAQVWADALDRAGFQLMGCRVSERHLYHRSLPSCVWCDRVAAGGGDHYPSTDPRIVIPQPVPAQGRYTAVPAGTWVPPAPMAHHRPVPPVPVAVEAQKSRARTAAKVAATVLVWVFVILVVVSVIAAIVAALS
jgi:DNA-binding helix-hairpin-helix protein with protein kinase domain